MSERLTPQDKYLEYLGMDEDDYRQIQKWNREGRICTSTGSKMNPESHKLIQQKVFRTGFQHDPQDVPHASNYIPPFGTEKNNVSEVDQTKVRLPIPVTPAVTHPIQTLDVPHASNYIPPFGTEKNNVSEVDQTKVRLPIPVTPAVTHPIQTLDTATGIHDTRKEVQHKYLIEGEEIQMAYFPKELEEGRMHKPKHLNKLDDVQNETELIMDISEADDRQLQNLIQERKRQLLRKQTDCAEKILTLMILQELCTEAEMDGWNNPSSQLKGGQGNNAVNRRALESPVSSGPSMDGKNNTQLVINGTINGTFNYAHQSGDSDMMHLFYLAVIIALLGYLMLRD